MEVFAISRHILYVQNHFQLVSFFTQALKSWNHCCQYSMMALHRSELVDISL